MGTVHGISFQLVLLPPLVQSRSPFGLPILIAGVVAIAFAAKAHEEPVPRSRPDGAVTAIMRLVQASHGQVNVAMRRYRWLRPKEDHGN